MSFIKNISQSFKNSGLLFQLIIINSAIFLTLNIIGNVVVLNNSDLYKYVGLPAQLDLFVYHAWALFTYMFTQIDLSHLFFNMLWLYFMGQIFNTIIGHQRMLFVYLAGGLSGGILFLLVGNVLPGMGGFMVGSSAAVMAIAVACGFYAPNMIVQLLLFGQVRLKWIVLSAFILSSVIDISINSGGKISHIGGALFGMLFALQLEKGKDMSAWFTKMFNRSSKLKVVHKQKLNDEDYNYNKKQEQLILDEILDKINRSGYESLSSKDKETLHRLSKKK